jgi:hypothetical protein
MSFSLKCRLTDVTFEAVEPAAGIEATSRVCALAATGATSRARAAAADGRKDLSIKPPISGLSC